MGGRGRYDMGSRHGGCEDGLVWEPVLGLEEETGGKGLGRAVLEGKQIQFSLQKRTFIFINHVPPPLPSPPRSLRARNNHSRRAGNFIVVLPVLWEHLFSVVLCRLSQALNTNTRGILSTLPWALPVYSPGIQMRSKHACAARRAQLFTPHQLYKISLYSQCLCMAVHVSRRFLTRDLYIRFQRFSRNT